MALASVALNSVFGSGTMNTSKFERSSGLLALPYVIAALFVVTVKPRLTRSTPHDEMAPVQYVRGVDGTIALWGGSGVGWSLSITQSALPACSAWKLSNSARRAAVAGAAARASASARASRSA